MGSLQWVSLFYHLLLSLSIVSLDAIALNSFLGLMRSDKERETKPPKQLEDGYCCSASEQQ